MLRAHICNCDPGLEAGDTSLIWILKRTLQITWRSAACPNVAIGPRPGSDHWLRPSGIHVLSQGKVWDGTLSRERKVKVCHGLRELESRVLPSREQLRGPPSHAPSPTFAVVVADTVTPRRWWGGLEGVPSVLKSCTRSRPGVITRAPPPWSSPGTKPRPCLRDTPTLT